jgi:tetratricopeptide (TPR) repeat protein
LFARRILPGDTPAAARGQFGVEAQSTPDSMTRSIALLFVVFYLLALSSSDAAAQDAAAQMQEALTLERSLGDYEGAIELYRQIAADDAADRRVVAQALIQLGKAYESLGRAEAFSAYDRVAREFTEQEDLVAEARTRMRGLASENPPQPAGVEARQPGEMSNISFAGDREMGYYGVDLSPDGRYMAFRDGFYRDLQTDQDTKFETAEDCRLSTVRFSPDGSRLAYGCWGNAGAGVIDLASQAATRILDADAYFGREGGHEVEVFDWTRDGSSVLIAIETWEGDPSTHHLILQPVDGGAPTIVDPDYSYDGHTFWENNACLMRDDQFVFGDWQLWLGQEYDIRQLYIQRISVETQERENVLFTSGRDYMLMGCDKRANVLYYQETLSDERTFLWSAKVDEDGRLVGQKRLQQLPSSVFAHPLTQDGNLYYTPWGTNPFRRSWFGEIRHDPGIAQIAGSGATGFIFDWSNDGRFRMGMNPYSTTWVVLTDTDTEREADIDLGHFPQRWGFLTDHRVMIAHRSDDLTRTWIFDIETGSSVDSLDGQFALGVMPDGESLVFADSTGSNVCLVSTRLTDRSVKPFTCLENAGPSEYAGFPGSDSGRMIGFSRDGTVAAVTYDELDGDRVVRVFALDGSMDQFIDSKGRRVELLPDGSGAFLIGERTLDLMDFASGVETPFDPGLAEGYSFRRQLWKLHPDGTRFETSLNPPPNRNLTVIHNVKGLLEEKK